MLSVKFIETNGLLEFLQDIRPYGCHEGGAWIYRGQTDTSWELKPKAGREDYFNWMLEGEMAPASDGAPPSKRPKIDLERFWAWRALAVAYDGKLPENEFECLAYAQHYGLATRLLDWTTNPLVALYFAVEAQQDRHGAVWAYFPDAIIDISAARFDSVTRVEMYHPRPFDRRILAQAGLFTFHPFPQIALTAGHPPKQINFLAPDGVNLVKIEVGMDMKRLIRKELNDLGISRKALFPDLEGLSEFINWWTRFRTPPQRSAG